MDSGKGNSGHKVKTKRGLDKLLPYKNGNRVGVDVSREFAGKNEEQNARLQLCCAVTDFHGSPLAVSKRPLSLHISEFNRVQDDDSIPVSIV